MPSTRNPSGQTPNTSRPSQSQDSGGQWQGNQNQSQDDDLIEDRDEGDRVEVGDPVPEGDRTIRATRDAPLETGDDEDLPDDQSGTQGSSSERH
ncbi:MAG: hypothetical protein ACJ8OJ_19055 [Povalibacter sp.]